VISSGAAEDRRFRTNAKHKNLDCAILVIAGLCISLSSGCKKTSRAVFEPAQIHTITREFAAAASAAGPAGTRIWTAQRFSRSDPEIPDAVSISPKIEAGSEAGRGVVAKIVQALEGVATRHHLTEDRPITAGDSLQLTYRRAGIATHKINIVTGRKLAADGTPSSGSSEGQPRLAIILDDLGSDPAAANAIFSLPYPLTISVLPNHAHSVEIAEEAHHRGYEVMLHLPMQAIGEETPEPEELRPGMSSEDVEGFVNRMVEAVPYAVGVNNHQGSQATADAALMEKLMPVLRERGLFYIDSRTTAATVAYDTARKDNVQTAFRNAPFLDDVAEAGAVRKQLQIAMREARAKGEAIAIGHPHAATLEALSEMLPQVHAGGVRLVFASDLVN
jgi:polysaccharide deacetylase 2 family uncharacterized protein YibQ